MPVCTGIVNNQIIAACAIGRFCSYFNFRQCTTNCKFVAVFAEASYNIVYLFSRRIFFASGQPAV